MLLLPQAPQPCELLDRKEKGGAVLPKGRTMPSGWRASTLSSVNPRHYGSFHVRYGVVRCVKVGLTPMTV